MIRTILRAVWTALYRSQSSIASVTGNIFFPVTLYFMGTAGAFLFLLAALVLLFPLSSDPMRKIPPERLRLWPLNTRRKRILRWLTPWLNPVTWVLAALAVWGIGRSISFGLLGAFGALVLAGFLIPSIPMAAGFNVQRLIPRFPGHFGILLRKDLRQIIVSLEFWMALLLSASTAAYKIFVAPLHERAGFMIGLLVVLAFASYSACIFGLDGEAGVARYKLLPLPGWAVLVSKTAALLLVVGLLTIHLAMLPCLAGMLMVAAVSQVAAIIQRSDQVRWRFSSGPTLRMGFVQLPALGLGLGGTYYWPAAGIVVSVLIFGVTTWWNGHLLE